MRELETKCPKLSAAQRAQMQCSHVCVGQCERCKATMSVAHWQRRKARDVPKRLSKGGMFHHAATYGPRHQMSKVSFGNIMSNIRQGGITFAANAAATQVVAEAALAAQAA